MDQPTLAYGVDIGGTKVLIGLVDVKTGKVLDSHLISTKVLAGPQAVTNDIVEAIQQIQTARPSLEILKKSLPIGLAVAGQIDANNGIVRFAPNLEWRNYPLQQQLKQVLNASVYLLNDVRAAAWGEWIFGAGQGCEDVLCLFFGTGIGGAVVSSGRMLTGASNAAAELGHVVIDNTGPLCTCGNHGCFEAIAGGWAIARNLKEAAKANPLESRLLLEMVDGKPENLTARHLFHAYDAKDPLAVRLFYELADAASGAVSGLVNAFNPQKLILGGGIIEGSPDLVEIIRNGVTKRSLAVAVEPLEITTALLGPDAGVVGAATFAANS